MKWLTYVSCPLCGWSGNPAPGLMVKWSSIRNGEKFFSWGVPIERRTLAPAPSACSRAKKAFWIPLGVVILSAFGVVEYEADGKLESWFSEGFVVVLSVNKLLITSIRSIIGSLNIIENPAMMIEKKRRSNFIWMSQELYRIIWERMRNKKNVLWGDT